VLDFDVERVTTRDDSIRFERERRDSRGQGHVFECLDYLIMTRSMLGYVTIRYDRKGKERDKGRDDLK